jgi:thiaminase
MWAICRKSSILFYFNSENPIKTIYVKKWQNKEKKLLASKISPSKANYSNFLLSMKNI